MSLYDTYNIYCKFMTGTKKIAFCIVAIVLSSGLYAQTDSLAKAVVLRYLDILNYDNLPDKTVYMESAITENNFPGDTMYMKRWFYGGNHSRIEIHHHGKQLVGFCSNGKEYWHYRSDSEEWDTLSLTRYLDSITGYHYLNPLHSWEARSLEFKQCWAMDWEGKDIYRVAVDDPDRLKRFYLFEKESGLLFLITNIYPDQGKRRGDVDWRAVNEYITVDDKFLFPSVESYQHSNSITIYFTQTHLLPFDKTVFEIETKK